MADLNAEQIRRGKVVAGFLASDAWPEVQEEVARRAFQEFKDSKGTPDELVALWQRMQGVKAVEREFRIFADRANLDETETE